MSNYKNILVAVDLSKDSSIVLNKALSLADKSQSQISMVHVMEPISIGYAIEVSSIDLDGLYADANEQSRQKLLEIGKNAGIPVERLHTILGQPAREIRELAKTIDADLVVMGNHGRHGWELLFGSTSTGVSHGLECDLLSVHVAG